MGPGEVPENSKKAGAFQGSRLWPFHRKESVEPRTLNVQAVSTAREVPGGEDRNEK